MAKKAFRSRRKDSRVLPVKSATRGTDGTDRDIQHPDHGTIVLVQEPEDDQDRLDILFGSGISSNKVLSNCLYLQLICEHAAHFAGGTPPTGREKAILASEIVEQVRMQNGRFLKKMGDGSNAWFDVGEQVAVAKTFRQLSLVAERGQSCNVEDFLEDNALGDDDTADRLAWAQVSKAFEENHHDHNGSNETALVGKTRFLEKMPVVFKAAAIREEDAEFELINVEEEKTIAPAEKPKKSAKSKAKNKEDGAIDERLRLAYEKLLSTPQKKQLEQLRRLQATDVEAATKIITVPQFNKPVPGAEENVAKQPPSKPSSAKLDPAGDKQTQASTTPSHATSTKYASTEDGIDLSLGMDTPQSANDYPSPAPDGGWRCPAKPNTNQVSKRQGFLSPIKPPKRPKKKVEEQQEHEKIVPETPPDPPRIERKISGAAQFLANNTSGILPFVPPSTNTAAANARLPKSLEYLAYMAETQRSPFTVKKFLSQHPGAILNTPTLPPLNMAALDSPVADEDERCNDGAIEPLSDDELRHSLFSRSIPQAYNAAGGVVEEDVSRGNDRRPDTNDEAAVPPLKELNTTVSQDLACQMADDDDGRW